MTENSETMTDKITRRLVAAFAPVALEIIDESHKHAGHAGHNGGGQSHFRVKIASAAFAGQSMVARHRAVYAALADLMGEDGTHALALDIAAENCS